MDLLKTLGLEERAPHENAVTYALYPGERGCALLRLFTRQGSCTQRVTGRRNGQGR